MGYQPPFINLETLKSKLPGRIDYYRVRLNVNYNNVLEIKFSKNEKLVYTLQCHKRRDYEH